MDEFELREWWLRRAQEEITATVPKAVEYSATDLEIMGAAMEQMGAAPAGRGVEAAIAFYALGKLSRIVGRLAEGAEPSDDSWFDLGVYARMAQRVREVGEWPGEAAAGPEGSGLLVGEAVLRGEEVRIECGMPYVHGPGDNRVCTLPPHPENVGHNGPQVQHLRED